jgi:hypothetical protein
MTLTATLILNIVLDVAILGALAFVMSRPSKLTPHGADAAPAAPGRRQAHERAHARGERAASPLRRPLLD